jgi:endonuclease-3
MAKSYLAETRRKKVAPKKQRVGPVIDLLAELHADARIALRFESPLELLVSVMLSAQTTDVNVNRVTERLFRKYRRPEDYLAVPQEELERDIFATGFYRQKAKSLRGMMQRILEVYGGEVPEAFDDLLTLPGVARKTANVVSAERGNAQGIVVDTHVRRLSQRLAFTRQEDPVKIERDLVEALGFSDDKPVELAREWGVRRLGEQLAIRTRAGNEKRVVADVFPAYDDDGGLLVALTPTRG